jgi:protein tyrosine phosphatase
MFSYLSDDYNRVVLDQLPDVPDSDYINASYVDVSIHTQHNTIINVSKYLIIFLHRLLLSTII